MVYPLSERARHWQTMMRAFVDERLIPWEVHAEMNGGWIPKEELEDIRTRTKEMGLYFPSLPKDAGGAELSKLEIAVIQEQVGRVTNWLGSCYVDLSPFLFYTANEHQMERYVRPMLARGARVAYAITEEGAGSDVDAIQATAKKEGNWYVLNGVKLHVTAANLSDWIIFQAKLEDGSHALFYVDKGADGVSTLRTPKYMHNYRSHHLVMKFENVCVSANDIIDPQGRGLEWTYDWFRQERMKIAARCCGAASRLIDEATAFARQRVQFDRLIWDNQAVQFPMADSLTELWAGRLMTYKVAEAMDRGDDVKIVHAMCSMAKLFCSELAHRVADRAVQIFGGRGCMRENVAERYYRESRVDRIWEGTSEIQRIIVARGLRKRGQGALTDVGQTDAAREWHRKLRPFVEQELMSWEMHAEENDGQIPAEVRRLHRDKARELGLWLPSIPTEYGGAGLTASEILAVHEEIGRCTNGVGCCYHDFPSFLIRAATEWQMEYYVQPMLDDKRHECYAITEEGAGSDIDAIQASAKRDRNGYVLNGLKWHVTGADDADIIIFLGREEDGSHALFYVDKNAAGVETVRTPAYSHTYPSHRPIMKFTNVKIPSGALIGRDGDGLTLTYEWFRQERMKIAAQCCGAASRLIDEALNFAIRRIQFGRPIFENQAVSFMLADSLVDLWAGRLMVHRLAQAIDTREENYVLDAMCSMAKLYCSEMANRVADRAVQIFGGRGYMREYAAERFYRELRCERIRGGTSEIQRMAIAHCLAEWGQDALIR